MQKSHRHRVSVAIDIALDARVPVRRARGDVFVQNEDAANIRALGQRADDVHLRSPGIGEAHLDAPGRGDFAERSGACDFFRFFRHAASRVEVCRSLTLAPRFSK